MAPLFGLCQLTMNMTNYSMWVHIRSPIRHSPCGACLCMPQWSWTYSMTSCDHTHGTQHWSSLPPNQGLKCINFYINKVYSFGQRGEILFLVISQPFNYDDCPRLESGPHVKDFETTATCTSANQID